MAIEEAITAKLESVSALTALVGSRIYPDQLNQDFTLPAVTYELVDRISYREVTGPVGKARSTFTLRYYAKTKTDAKAGGEVIRKNMDGYKGTISGVTIYATSLQDGTTDDIYDEMTEIWHRDQDFLFSHTEALS